MGQGKRPPIFGLLAEFETSDELLEGARRAQQAGYRKKDAYSPFPVEGLAQALGYRRRILPKVVLLGGLAGGLGGFLLQYWANTSYFPMNIGGRPYAAWPAYIPITFELTVLAGAISAVLGMLGLNGLPRPHHPLFNVPRFALATRSHFFLCIEATDPLFETQKTRRFLEELGAREIFEVEH